MISEIAAWLLDPANWTGGEGVLRQSWLHLLYCVFAVCAAAVLAVPLGLYIGHTGRGSVLVVGFSNAVRALPTLGLVTGLAMLYQGSAALAALVVLAFPAVLSGTYAGVNAVPADAVDAARGMGMSSAQRLWQVELPNALPLLMGGVRNAMLQVMATTAIAAYVGLGGLGKLLIEGQAIRHYDQMASAAILIALLAVLVDLALAGLTRSLVPRGVMLVVAETGAGPRGRREQR
ncbi:ABC transporter permease [Actinopolyspora erythraea]|uniref:ABC transporter permease n=1 Tax=Actinopolyspora erythraea TaxID=414996 RepID=A0A099D2T0_9ACTN|nr:ABC transporter permease subunit [Actinopolyspora erythraea]ASU77690.1 ABC transporter permease [Actinopolyspora erythraea]KGI80082.1 ABC transporter permease [Actinopolyspora erythraea]